MISLEDASKSVSERVAKLGGTPRTTTDEDFVITTKTGPCDSRLVLKVSVVPCTERTTLSQSLIPRAIDLRGLFTLKINAWINILQPLQGGECILHNI